MTSTVLITGAGRGIGLEFAKQYAAAGWRVLATARDPKQADALRAMHGAVTVHALDVADPASIHDLGRRIDDPIDVLINNAGLGAKDVGDFGNYDAAAWLRTLAVNTLGPVLVTEALMPQLERGQQKKIVTLTSRLGSIGANESGGMLCYRASKAGLNGAMHSLGLDLKRRGFSLVVVHPGWVKTDMGGPSAPLSTEQSVIDLRRLIERLTPEDGGKFFNHDGSSIPW